MFERAVVSGHKGTKTRRNARKDESYHRLLISIFASLLITFISSAQEVKVKGYFSADSVKLGKPITFYLSAKYPQASNVLFPDSSFSFAPFEFQKKNFVATQTKDGFSYDSVAYTLSTFEIDSIQILKLPVFVVHPKDCTAVFSEMDKVFFDKTVKNLPDSVQLEKIPLKTNTNYFKVSWLLNYPLLSIIIGALIVLLILGWVIFGKRIRKYFKIKKMNKNYLSFVSQFDGSIEKAQATFTSQSTEAALLVWKKYLENLLDKPYTKYTTKEIRERESDAWLGESLSAVDKMIYANVQGDKAHFINLKNYSEDQFNKKLEEVKNG
ncbi:MAG: hypothetical protein ACKVOQ_11890 [Cyclobacteriaceae bacterium]